MNRIKIFLTVSLFTAFISSYIFSAQVMADETKQPKRYGPYGPDYPEATYVPHKYKEHTVDIGEVVLNYATVGSPDKPAIVLIPAQTESWWGYEKVMEPLSKHFQVFAIDLRGQGRSSRTPGRYTFDNFGNDVIKFITYVIKKPVVVCGLSSGGVVSAWLSAYAPPGMIRGAYYEDPALFVCEQNPKYGPGIKKTAIFPVFNMFYSFLGSQWSKGDYDGLAALLGASAPDMFPAEPSQSIKEYDPEWAEACVTGFITASLDHARMLSQVKCPVLFTHHGPSEINKETGMLVGALIKEQVDQVERLVKEAGQPFTRLRFPEMGHSMHGQDPELYVRTLLEWVKTLPSEVVTRKAGIFSGE